MTYGAPSNDPAALIRSSDFDRAVRARAAEEARRAFTGPQLWTLMEPRSIPLAMVNAARSRVFHNPDGTSNITVTATDLTALPDVPSGRILCSGADVRLDVTVRAAEAGASGELALGFLWDGQPLPGRVFGSWVTEDTAYRGATFWAVVEGVTPGSHVFHLAGLSTGSNDGTVYAGAGNTIEILATELP